MYEVLPTAVAFVTGWIIAGLAVARAVKGLVPLIKGIRAAVVLVNEQLVPDKNGGESLVDKVDHARQSADAAKQSAEQTRAALAEHLRSDHGGGV